MNNTKDTLEVVILDHAWEFPSLLAGLLTHENSALVETVRDLSDSMKQREAHLEQTRLCNASQPCRSLRPPSSKLSRPPRDGMSCSLC